MSHRTSERRAAERPTISRRRFGMFIAAGAVALIAGGIIGNSVRLEQHDQGLNDPAKRHLAREIISTFENSTTTIQYAYTENLHDGRGITAGSAGFTSGTGDMEEVVVDYTAKVPDNPLAKYIPALKQVNGSGSTAGLEGLPAAWKRAAQDQRFRAAQDEVDDIEYYQPAREKARTQKIGSALGELIFYDTVIQQGDGDDPDSLSAVIAETNAQEPRNTVTETAWLLDFLDVRRSHLMHAADPATRAAWRDSVDRVNVLESFVREGNLSLQPPLRYTVYGDYFEVVQ